MAEIRRLSYEDLLRITGGIEIRDAAKLEKWLGAEPTEEDMAMIRSAFDVCEAEGCTVLVLNARSVSRARGEPSPGTRWCSTHHRDLKKPW